MSYEDNPPKRDVQNLKKGNVRSGPRLQSTTDREARIVFNLVQLRRIHQGEFQNSKVFSGVLNHRIRVHVSNLRRKNQDAMGVARAAFGILSQSEDTQSS